jgi:hypothetical protein
LNERGGEGWDWFWLVKKKGSLAWLIGRLTLPFQVCYLLLLQACLEVDWRREEGMPLASAEGSNTRGVMV